jgi:hypothetical protein
MGTKVEISASKESAGGGVREGERGRVGEGQGDGTGERGRGTRGGRIGMKKG